MTSSAKAAIWIHHSLVVLSHLARMVLFSAVSALALRGIWGVEIVLGRSIVGVVVAAIALALTNRLIGYPDSLREEGFFAISIASAAIVIAAAWVVSRGNRQDFRFVELAATGVAVVVLIVRIVSVTRKSKSGA